MTTRTLGRTALLIGALAAFPSLATSQDVYVIRGGTVHTLAGDAIENGTVVIADGRIQAVGVSVDVPAGATVIDATGLQVYPGIFDAFSNLGLREIGQVAVTVDERELGEFNPHLSAATAVHPASEHISVTRANGVTHVVSAPAAQQGGIGGQASLIHLEGWTVEEMLISSSVGVVLSWPSLGGGGGRFSRFRRNQPFSRLEERYEENLERLQGWLVDARAYQQAVTGGASLRRDLRLEAMGPVLSGDTPFLVQADAERDIRNAVEFMTTEGLRMVLVGGANAWKVADLLAEHDIPVLSRATQNTPGAEDEDYFEPFAAPARLYAAGVRFAITGWRSAGPNPPSRTLAYEAANAVSFGLPWEEAIRSITRYPAEILGLGDQIGTIEEGKIANLIVVGGDPLQIRTAIHHVFIDGHEADLNNKHRELYEKYRARP